MAVAKAMVVVFFGYLKIMYICNLSLLKWLFEPTAWFVILYSELMDS